MFLLLKIALNQFVVDRGGDLKLDDSLVEPGGAVDLLYRYPARELSVSLSAPNNLVIIKTVVCLGKLLIIIFRVNSISLFLLTMYRPTTV